MNRELPSKGFLCFLALCTLLGWSFMETMARVAWRHSKGKRVNVT